MAMIRSFKKRRAAVLRRLRYVAEKLIDYRKVDMGFWFYHRKKGHVHTDKEGNPRLGCGTTACFLGWALTDKRFRDMTGLMLVPFDNPNSIQSHVPGTRNCKGIWDGDTVYRHLGMNASEFDYLFRGAQDGRKKNLLRRLRNVASGEF